MSCEISMSDAKALLSVAASVAASLMVFRSTAQEFIPYQVKNYFFSYIHRLSRYFSSQFTIVIEEYRGGFKNQMFEASEIYLGSKVATASTERIRLGKGENEKNMAFTLDKNEEIEDVFEKVQFKWTFVSERVESIGGRPRFHGGMMLGFGASEVKHYELSFSKKHKEKVFNSYLPYILERSEAIKAESKAIKLHTVDEDGCWSSSEINLDHPMTFNTLAMDSEEKKALIEDLDNFVKGKEYYRKIGKAWKRGYLLYGPPGTGKSSLIAAMSNYLNYDIYDLDLTAVESNSDLRSLLLSLSNRSILVMEDIDCSINIQNRESKKKSEDEDAEDKVTLSGLLNFVDGLSSCCGEEHIIVFTTNHKEELDPALLRPGRMDMHFHMSYCTYSAFKQLALNYLGLDHHQLFSEVERLLGKAEVTPAEVAGEMMKTIDAEASLQGFLKFLHNKVAAKESNSAEERESETEDTD